MVELTQSDMTDNTEYVEQVFEVTPEVEEIIEPTKKEFEQVDLSVKANRTAMTGSLTVFCKSGKVQVGRVASVGIKKLSIEALGYANMIWFNFVNDNIPIFTNGLLFVVGQEAIDFVKNTPVETAE